MPVETAALVLAWLVILVLVFAMAGMLALIRRLEASVQRLSAGLSGGAGSGARRNDAAARFAPRTRPFSLVLVTQEQCPSCAALLPEFLDFVREYDSKVDFHLLTDRAAPALPADIGMPVTVDPETFAVLSPGYTPGLVIIDRTRSVVEVGPAADLESVARWIERQGLTSVSEEGK